MCGEFVKMKFQDLWFRLVSHIILWALFLLERKGSWLQISGFGSSLFVSFFASSDKFPCVLSHWAFTCSTLIPRVKHTLMRRRWRTDCSTWTVKNISRCAMQIPCIKSQTWVAAKHHRNLEKLPVNRARGIIFHCKFMLLIKILSKHS